MKFYKKEKIYLVLKVGNEYLANVWEEHNDEVDNVEFTEYLEEAMTFKQNKAPKYLPVNTLEEMCEYLNGKLVTVRKRTVIEEIDPT